jgi:hypothetical protein
MAIGVSKHIGDRVTEVVHLNEPAERRCPRLRSIPTQDEAFFVTLVTAHTARYNHSPLCILRHKDERSPSAVLNPPLTCAGSELAPARAGRSCNTSTHWVFTADRFHKLCGGSLPRHFLQYRINPSHEILSENRIEHC